MNARRSVSFTLLAALALPACAGVEAAGNPTDEAAMTEPDPFFPPIRSDLPLGTFSVSLAVKDLAASRAFYEKLGFEAVGGDPASGWQIVRNGTTTLGLFQGMFEGNLLTFNPGWSIDGRHPEQFPDVRELQQKLDADGVALASRADPESTGPASISLVDPDGNVVLIDQHVPRPSKR